MKTIILAAMFLVPGVSMANDSAWDGDYTSARYYNPGRHDHGYGNTGARGCREGDTRYFSNDGYCENGGIRNTFRVCRNGRYVIVRQECVR